MKYLKWFGFLVLGLLLIYLLLCVVGPKNMNTTRTATMQASPAQTYNMYNNLEKWSKWSPWSLRDTSMVIDYGNKKEGVGASYKWKGDNSGSGSMEILESVKNESMKAKMHMDDYDSNSFIEFKSVPNGNKIDLTWSMEDEKDFPFLLRGMILLTGQKGSLKNDFDKGLSNLKKIVEERAKGIYNGYKINPVQVEEKHFAMNRQMVKMDNIQQFQLTSLGSLYSSAQKSAIEIIGKPCGLIFKWDESNGQADMAAAIQLSEAVNIKDASSWTLPAGNALEIDYYGDYENSALPHYAMEDYLKDYGLLNNPPVLEEYVTGASEEKDPNKWLTKITYYIAQ